MKIILDTSAYVGFKQNIPELVETITQSEIICFSPIVMGELMFGFRNGSKFEQNMKDLNKFLNHEAVDLIPVGNITADRYARIVTLLKKKGSPIPTNDIWIAAQTMEFGAELLTFDKHFKKIEGLVYTIFKK